MPLQFRKPILYLITPGASTPSTTSNSPEFKSLLATVSSAVEAGIDLIQIREKNLAARALYELAEKAAALTRGTGTRLLVNDRADIAAAASADGVHLTSQSLDARVIRKTFGRDFLIGVSTHSQTEAGVARDFGADFVVFGPVFATTSKEKYGAPVGVKELARVSRELYPFPVLGLGGITVQRAAECLRAGATGIAGISLFEDPDRLGELVSSLRP